MTGFYVYCLFRPNGLPCYIGKGRGDRIDQHERLGQRHYNPHLRRIIANSSGGLPKIKIREGLTHAEAIEIEGALIGAIGRGAAGPLVNLTDGGDGGLLGMTHGQEARDKIRHARLGTKASVETKAKMSAIRKGARRTPTSDETKLKISLANKGKLAGIPKSPQTRGAMSQPKSVQHRAAMSEALRRRWSTTWADRRVQP